MSTGGESFVARVIAASARRPYFTILLVLVLAAWGWWSLGRGPLDAIPDLSDVQVIVFTEWMGQSPDLVEDQITYPITTALLAAPKVRYVRGQSMFGMSFVYVIFDDGTDIYWARSRVLEYLNEVQDQLPAGTRPTRLSASAALSGSRRPRFESGRALVRTITRPCPYGREPSTTRSPGRRSRRGRRQRG